MKRNLLLLFLSLAFLMPTKLHADTMYALQSNDTLTFHYTTGPISMHMGNDDGTRLYIIDDEYVMEYGNVHLPEWREAGIAHVVFSSSFADARPTSTAYWFYKCDKLVSVDSIKNLNTEVVNDMSYMFYGCSSLTTLDLSGMNTKNVTNMHMMFGHCSRLASLNISDFDTSKVRDMSYMFCEVGLSSIDVSCFDTSLVEDMQLMFKGCTKLKELDLSGFDTRNVKHMEAMFRECSAIDSLYLGSFELTSLVEASFMFQLCINLKTIVVSEKWNFNSSIFSTAMFMGCSSLVGGLGTTLKENGGVDGSYAHIDGGPNNPGLLTADTMGQLVDNTGETRAYCVLNNFVLTFYYDNKVNSRQGLKYPINKYDGINGKPIWFHRRKEVVKAVIDPSFAAFRPTSTARWFYNFANMLTIEGISNLNTSQVTTMTEMFRFCDKLNNLDLSSFDTSNVTDMSFLVCYCTSLSNLNVSTFNTSKVVDMQHMFHMSPATELDLRSFDTKNVTDMNTMFESTKLKTIYVSDKWSTESVTSSLYMFSGSGYLVGGKGTKYDRNHTDHEYACIDGGMCAPGYLTGDSESAAAEPYAVLDDEGTLTFYYDGNKGCREGTLYGIPNESYQPGRDGQYPEWYRKREEIKKVDFDSSFSDYRPIRANYWFYLCNNIEKFENLKNLNTEEVIDMRSMFEGCSKIQELDCSGFNTSKVEDMDLMFASCNNIQSIPVNKFNTSNVKYMSNMFSDCHKLINLDVSGFNTENVHSMSEMFNGCTVLPTLDVSHFNTSKVDGMRYMFGGCSSLSVIDVKNFDTSNVRDMRGMFLGCEAVSTLDVSHFNTAKVEDMASMFSGCKSVPALNVSSFNTSNVDNMSHMFSGCTFTEIDLSNFNTSKVEDMYMMFCSCKNLKSLDLSTFNTENVYDMNYMFDGCSSLTNLYVTNFNTQNVMKTNYMFRNCESLKELDLSSFNTSSLKEFGDMFFGCTNLKTIYVSERWNTDHIRNTNIFSRCVNLEGGAGTRYDAISDPQWSKYARIDGGPDSPGYFTYKEYVIPTSINAVPEESGKAQDEVWYNLQGVRIDNPAKGIYILNGKKVVRK